MQTTQMTSKPKGLAKLWWKIRNAHRFYRLHMDTLAETKEQVRRVFGDSSGIDAAIDATTPFHRWRVLLGKSLARKLFGGPFPYRKRPYKYFEWYTKHVGIDLKKELRVADKTWTLDGIALPLPNDEADMGAFEFELPDLLFSSYLLHNFESFGPYCEIVGDRLGEFNEGPYEYGPVRLEEGDVVFDCGANIGIFSAVASRYGGQVYAFEAIPDIIEQSLSKTVAMNPRICICQFAVWDKEETLEFSFLADCHTSSGSDALLKDQFLEIPRIPLTVSAIPLDTFVERNGIERVDFIKSDIEGAERNLLLGAKRVLREFAPKLSLCTYHLPDDPAVMRKLILDANPKYQIVEKFKKLYAHVPR